MACRNMALALCFRRPHPGRIVSNMPDWAAQGLVPVAIAAQLNSSEGA